MFPRPLRRISIPLPTIFRQIFEVHSNSKKAPIAGWAGHGDRRAAGSRPLKKQKAENLALFSAEWSCCWQLTEQASAGNELTLHLGTFNSFDELDSDIGDADASERFPDYVNRLLPGETTKSILGELLPHLLTRLTTAKKFTPSEVKRLSRC